MALPGKNFRTQVLATFNVWLQVDERSLNIIDRVVGMLHNAFLLYVQDRWRLIHEKLTSVSGLMISKTAPS